MGWEAVIIDTILSLEHITKRYPGVTALQDVSMSFDKGEIHALMGENGAGKSTLIKIISGAELPDSGSIAINGNCYASMTPALSKRERIGVIYQEFNLVPSLSVAENIFLGDRIGGKKLVDYQGMREQSAKIFEELGVSIDPRSMVQDLSIAQQQIVEIAKAIHKEASVLIMDEPSAALANVEVENMLNIVLRLKEKGVTILYISHRMKEVFRIADRVSIMRDGRYVGTYQMNEITRKDLITRMVGRELTESYPERTTNIGETIFAAKRLCGNGDSDISFELHKGEILGFAGLVGSGRTELMKMIYGAVRPDSGRIYLKGKEVTIRSPKQAIAHGIGLIPENRKTEGAFLEYPIDWNIGIMSLKRIAKRTIVSDKEVEHISEKFRKQLRIKTPSGKQLVKNLSGGNQQKVVLAKVLAAETDIIIFDEPTRGIDVGAKQEIYQLMNDLIEEGVSILMVSSEMEELIGMSDRILILHEGRCTGTIERNEFDQNRILEMASGL